ncbi:MAG: MBL fold metallo-hydrolase, partial [Actinomycetota bacterium]
PEFERDVAVGLLDLRPFHEDGRYMQQLTEHVWWHPPGPPDRPALCAVVGTRWTVMLDAGSSRRHTREALDGLPVRPRAVVLTHAHWDHVFGAVEIGGQVIAHAETAAELERMRLRDWNDETSVGEHLRAELPAPRTVEIAPVGVVFRDRLDLDLGGVRVHVRHVVSDHCADACIAYVGPDRLLFLGDALCADKDVYTREKAFPLFELVLAYDAEIFVEGHHPAPTTRAELEELVAKARAAADGTVIAGDEDSEYFGRGFGPRG